MENIFFALLVMMDQAIVSFDISANFAKFFWPAFSVEHLSVVAHSSHVFQLT